MKTNLRHLPKRVKKLIKIGATVVTRSKAVTFQMSEVAVPRMGVRGDPGAFRSTTGDAGFHEQPTVLLLSFNEAVDAARAQNPRNYRIIDPNGPSIAVKSAL